MKTNSLANDYYLKAADHYPYDLAEFLESINYALSYNENHADAHCLMGQFYRDQLMKYEEATAHFDRALENDARHLPTYYQYIRLCIMTEEFEKAIKLIRFAQTIKGVYKSSLLHREAIILEIKGQFKEASKLLKIAIEKAYYSDDVRFYENERKRIKNKRKNRKKKNGKK